MENTRKQDWIHAIRKLSDLEYEIVNRQTGWRTTFVYRNISCTRGLGYKVETGWGGPLEPLLDSFLPVLDYVFRQTEPHSESFTWDVQTVETQYGGKEYTDMDHMAKYTCDAAFPQPGTDQPLMMEMSLSFSNGRFGGVDLRPHSVDIPRKRLSDMEKHFTTTIREKLGLK